MTVSRLGHPAILFAACALLLAAAAPPARAVEVQIASAGLHVAVLRANGTVWTWGENLSGQLGDGTVIGRDFPAPVPNLVGVVSVAAGKSTTLAAKDDGTVWQWGNFSDFLTNFLVPEQILGLAGIVSVATAGDFSYALKGDGTVWAWGMNSGGALGDGTFVTGDKRRNPVQVSGLTGAVAIAATSSGGVALRSDGTVWQWGASPLSDGTSVAVQVAGLSDVVEIAAGQSHKLARKSGGTVWAWGTNETGQLGDGTRILTTIPVQVIGLSGVNLIAAGTQASYARTNDGTLWAWGGWTSLDGGFLGDGSTVAAAPDGPVVISGITHPLAISASVGLSGAKVAVLQSDGTILTWGGYLALGTGDAHAGRRFGTPALTGATSVAAGDGYLLARRYDGTAWAWGWNGTGQLGDGTQTPRATPTQIAGLANVAEVAAGAAHSIALDTNGAVWAWGWNAYGQLGDGGFADRASPATIGGLTDVVAVSAGRGGAHNLALKSNGTVWAWGVNDYGQLGDGSTIHRATPVQVAGLSEIVAVAAGYRHSLALRSDGTVMAWGRNVFGQVGDATTTDRLLPVVIAAPPGITSIAAGDTFSLAVRADGTLWVWGNNGDGQLGGGITGNRLAPFQNTTLTGVVAAAAGYYHSAVLRNDGSLWAFGRSGLGQTGYTSSVVTLEHRVTPETGFAGLTASIYHTAAVKADGTLRVYGNAYYGEIGNSGRNSFWLPAEVSFAPAGTPFNALTSEPPPGDTQPPSVPINVTASPVSASQVRLAWDASLDHAGVASYKVYRDGVPVAMLDAAAFEYDDGALAGTTAYSYRVEACDAAGNCSAPSVPAAATTLAPGQYAWSQPLAPGFNLIGNALDTTLHIVPHFGNQDAPVAGVTANVVSVWKWNAAKAGWAFFSPQLTAAGNAAYAASHHYEVLSAIEPGEGYWVNAAGAMTLPVRSGNGFDWTPSTFGALPPGFSLVAQASSATPVQFNHGVSGSSPPAVPTHALVSVWAWDALLGTWYFHSPVLEAAGGLQAVKDYADAHGYLHFQDYNKTLGVGGGFWVNKP